jgi:hypothetical protein
MNSTTGDRPTRLPGRRRRLYIAVIALSLLAYGGAILVASPAKQAVAQQASASQAPLKTWAVLASRDVQQTGLSDQVTAALAREKAVTLVDRERLDLVAKEMEIGLLGVSSGAGLRLKAGRILKADVLLVLAHQSADGKQYVRIAICDTLSGARLYTDAAPLPAADNAASVQSALKAILAGVARVREQFPEGVQQVLGVPAFVSRTLTHEFDYLQQGYANLLANALSACRGVAVIETEEAQQIVREISLTDGKDVERVVPMFVEGEFEVTRPKPEAEPVVAFDVKVAGAQGPARLLPRRKLKLAEAAAYVGAELPALVSGMSQLASARTLTADQQAEALIARADTFALLGDWEHSVGLREAALLLKDDTAQRTKLIQECYRLFYSDPPPGIQWGGEVHQALCVRKGEFWLASLAHIEYLIRNRKVPMSEVFTLAELVLDHNIQIRRVPNEALPLMRRAKDRFMFDVFPLVLSLESKGVGEEHQAQERLWWAGLMLHAAYRCEPYRSDAIEVDLDALYRVMTECIPPDLVPSRSMLGVLQSMARCYKDDKAGEYLAFLDRLAKSGRPLNAILARYSMIERRWQFVRTRLDMPAFLEEIAQLLNDYAELRPRLRPGNDYSLPYEISQLERDVKSEIAIARRRAAPSPPVSRPTPKDTLILQPVDLKVKTLAGEVVPFKGKDWNRGGRDSCYTMRHLFNCGNGVDVMWKDNVVAVMRQEGLLEEVFLGDRLLFDDVKWDGRYLWVGTQAAGIRVLTLAGEVAAQIGDKDGLPPAEKGMRLCPIEPGKVLAAGALGEHNRLWLAVVEFDGTKPRVNVFHQATRVLAVGEKWSEAADKRLAGAPDWILAIGGDAEGVPRSFLVGWGIWLRPLQVNPSTLEVSLFPEKMSGDDPNVYHVAANARVYRSPNNGKLVRCGQIVYEYVKEAGLLTHRLSRLDLESGKAVEVGRFFSEREYEFFGNSSHYGLVVWTWGGDFCRLIVKEPAADPVGFRLAPMGDQVFAADSTSVPSHARVESLAAASDLAAGPAPGAGGQIQVGLSGFHYELKAAVQAYAQLHPEVQVSFVEGDFLAGRVDVLGYYADFSYRVNTPSLQKYVEAHGGPPKEVTVAYWPFMMAVHPANPIKAITVAQLRQLFFNPEARWPHLGRSTDGRIRLYVVDSRRIAQTLVASGSAIEALRLSSRAVQKHRVQMPTILDEAFFKAMAGDEDGIMVWRHNKELAASGLKVLPIVCTPGQPGALPTDAAAVASGRYPLRLPLRVATHPGAPAHIQAFVAWLQTPQAGEAMASAQISRANYPSPIAHVSMAEKDVPSETPPPEDLPVPDVKFEGPIQGAAAVLPTEPLSRYFLVGNPSHLALYEQAIADAIHADGRLKLVDRTELSRVLAERRLQMLDYAALPSEPIISADVIVISHVVTEAARTYLRICAIHGPTGSLLSQLKCPIDPADPVTSKPPLNELVQRWWPAVLHRLRAGREKPRWVVLDVYAPSLELSESAEVIRVALQDALQADDRIFATTPPTGDEAQQEVLLRVLGLSAPAGGHFTPAADYLVDARLVDSTTIEMRLRNAQLAVLAEKTLTGTDAAALKLAALQWLAREVARNKAKPTSASTGVVADEWARRQAQAEVKIARQIRNQIPNWRFDESERIWRWTGPRPQPDTPYDLLGAAFTATDRHFRRAAQLDPTLEEAAYEVLPSLHILHDYYTRDDENVKSLAALWPLERFLDAFPQSTHHREVLTRLAVLCTNLARKVKLAPSADDKVIRPALYRKGLKCYALYMERHYFCGETDEAYHGYMVFEHYLYHLQAYIELAQPPDAELEALVADWSRRFDGFPDKATHSDFVRLMVFRHKNDKPAFLALLTKMQQRWPDPGHPQWSQTTSSVDGMIFRLFQGVGSSNSSFQLWHCGKRGIGDLPKVGYKPEDDKPQYGSSLVFSCPGGPKKVMDAIRAAGQEYKKVQPGAYFGSWGGSKRTNLQEVEDRHLLVIVGPFRPMNSRPSRNFIAATCRCVPSVCSGMPPIRRRRKCRSWRVPASRSTISCDFSARPRAQRPWPSSG